MILRARYLVPVGAPVIENGAVKVTDGRVSALGRFRDLAPRRYFDCGDAAILPGLVNAHTHLELSHLAGRVPPSRDFTAWLKGLLSHLDQSSRPESVQESVERGLCDSLAQGVLTLGDITRHPKWTREILSRSPLRCLSFGEVVAVGNRRDRLAARLDAAAEDFADSAGGDRFRIGISPHAPYTVEPESLRACADRADRFGLRTTTHLLESPDEATFTLSGSGPLADYLRAVGVWDDAVPVSGCSPVELLMRSAFLNSRALLAHVNYPTDEDLAIIARSGASVVYCPRTHAAFGHPPHRFRDMLAAGINVCLGTDSLASNPSLSMLDEMRFLFRAFPGVSEETLLEMATTRGAVALGWPAQTATIRIGGNADLVVVPLDPNFESKGWTALFWSDAAPVAVYVRGALLFPRHR